MEERVSYVYWCMHDRRMAVEMKGGCEGYGVMPSMAEVSCGAAWQVRERAEGWRLGYSGDCRAVGVRIQIEGKRTE